MRRKNNIDPTERTSIELREVLTQYMGKFTRSYEDTPGQILEAWPLIVGEKIGKMTRAISFAEGILNVRVSNSTLYSLLVQQEKDKLLEALRKKFPKVEIKNIQFRIG